MPWAIERREETTGEWHTIFFAYAATPPDRVISVAKAIDEVVGQRVTRVRWMYTTNWRKP